LITVLSIKPVNFGQIFALASVEIDLDGVVLVIHGIRAMRGQPIQRRKQLLFRGTVIRFTEGSREFSQNDDGGAPGTAWT
jgi:hypothetical protein